MKRTTDEKYAYNQKQNTSFSIGYCFGVSMYREYPKMSSKDKALVKELISVTRDNARSGDKHSKGIMCGVRDAANERKANKQKR